MSRTNLKSPLTSIKGAAELLREDVDAPDMDDADRRKFLDNIIADADRLGTIAGRLRDFARAENPVALGAAKLSAAIAGLRAAFPSLDIRASGDLDTPMRISEDNALIILSNLADNAARHGSSTLEVSAVRQGNRLKVTVADDGEGVSPNNRSQIFDSFFTTRRDSGGTGMGLAIVRAMLDAHGGAIRLIDSDHGTAFELTFPVTDAAPRDARLDRSRRQAAQIPHRRPRLLVIVRGLALRGLVLTCPLLAVSATAGTAPEPSLRQLKPLEPVQLLLDARLQLLARPLARRARPSSISAPAVCGCLRSVFRSSAATMSSPTSTGSAK